MSENKNESAFGFLRKRRPASGNPSAIGLSLNDYSKRNLALGLDRSPAQSRRPPKWLCARNIISALVVVALVSAYFFSRPQYPPNAQRPGEESRPAGFSNAGPPPPSFSAANPAPGGSAGTNDGVAQKAAQKSASDGETAPKKGETAPKKEGKTQNDGKGRISAEKHAFSERMMKEFVFNVDGLLRKSKDSAGVEVSEDDDVVLSEAPGEIIGEKEFRAVESAIKDYESLEKTAEKLKEILNSAKISKRNLDALLVSYKNTKLNLARTRERLNSKSVDLQKISEEFAKMKEERAVLYELISNIRIQIENNKKHSQRASEAKESSELERDVLRRNVKKKTGDLEYQNGLVAKIKKEIEEAQTGAEKTSRQNAERLKRREALANRKEALWPEVKALESEIKRLNGVIEELKRNNKELRATLRTMKSFNELLDNLKAEIDEYSNEQKDSALPNVTEKRQNKIKEREQVLARIKEFQEHAVRSLRSLFKDKQSDFDDLQPVLMEEIQKNEENLKIEIERLKELISKFEKSETEIKSVEKEILLLSEESSVLEYNKTVAEKKEEMADQLRRVGGIEGENAVLKEKLQRQEQAVEGDRTKLNAFLAEQKSLDESLRANDEKAGSLETRMAAFAEDRGAQIAEIARALSESAQTEQALGEKQALIRVSTATLNKEKDDVLSLSARLEKFLCVANNNL